jgi:hypothetical protein
MEGRRIYLYALIFPLLGFACVEALAFLIRWLGAYSEGVGPYGLAASPGVTSFSTAVSGVFLIVGFLGFVVGLFRPAAVAWAAGFNRSVSSIFYGLIFTLAIVSRIIGIALGEGQIESDDVQVKELFKSVYIGQSLGAIKEIFSSKVSCAHYGYGVLPKHYPLVGYSYEAHSAGTVGYASIKCGGYVRDVRILVVYRPGNEFLNSVAQNLILVDGAVVLDRK